MSEESERVKYLLKYWSHLQLAREYEQLENIIKEVREYIENNWISQKDADIHRFDNEELEIEIGDIAVILEILDKGNK